MLLLGVALLIWFGIGLGFGLPKARRTYLKEIAKYPTLYRERPGAVKREAMVDAGITLTGWMMLGLLAGVAFIAWRFLEMYFSEAKKRSR